MTIDLAAATLHLARTSPVLKRVMKACGPCTLAPRETIHPWETLVGSIASQQLSTKAAATILGRFRALGPKGRFPKPAEVLALDPEVLRGVGFSWAKIAGIRDLAEKVQDGTVPKAAVLARLPDEEIIARLTAVRGIGRWTVEMLLMFHLARPDVLPVDDLGVRMGYQIAYGLDEMPKPKALVALCEPWRPWRSVASWYMWRVVERHRAATRAARDAG